MVMGRNLVMGRKIITILLMYTRAQRDGLWDLHIYAFRKMLPYYYRYKHTNYARWGTVYLAEMHQLPKEVTNEFQKGNVVVKGTNKLFNQVSPDHNQERLNNVCKAGGGIAGITKKTRQL